MLHVKLIEPPCTERYARWCERSKIPHQEEFSPTRFAMMKYRMEFRGMKGELYMSYTEDLKRFTASHTYETITVGGGNFRYVLSGKKMV